MNKITIIGNLTADPEQRTTQSGKQVTKFCVAVNRRKEGTDYFNVSAWSGLAENCAKYLSKGRKVCVIGSVSLNTYKDHNGEARGTIEIMAEEVEFLSAREDKQAQTAPHEPFQNIPDDAKAINLGELPF